VIRYAVLLCVLVFGARAEGPGLIQYPSVSPDAGTIVFSAMGDLWAIDASGGVATRLTAHPGIEGRSAFSADGTVLAFESNRDGATNLYAGDVEGAGARMILRDIRRVTVSDRAQRLGGFDASGDALLFSSYLNRDIYRLPEMYRAPLDGGAVTPITQAHGRAPTPGSDGTIVFMRGYNYPQRSAYRGPGNLDIWRFDPGDGSFERVTGFDGQDLDPNILPDGSVVYLSAREGGYNIRRIREGGSDRGLRDGRELTEFAPGGGEVTIGHGARDLRVSRDGSLAAFVVWDTLYTLDLTDNDADPAPIGVRLGADSDRDTSDRIDLSKRVDAALLHPSGDAVAIAARGELVVRSTKEDHPTRRVTLTPARERDLAWSPDGEYLYFAADDGSLGSIFRARVTLSTVDLGPDEPGDGEGATDEDAEDDDQEGEGDEEPEDADEDGDDEEEETESIDHGARWAGALRFGIEPVVVGGAHCYAPHPSPDGTKLLYKRLRGDIVLHDLETGDERVIAESWSDPGVLWAPDSTHVLVTDTDLDFNADIFLYDTRPGEDGSVREPVNLTRHPDVDRSPQLSADGKVLTFLSDRDSDNWSWDVYAIHLDRALDGMPTYELRAYYEEAASAAKKREPLEPHDPEDDEDGEDAEESEQAEPLEFDADDAYLRVRRLTTTPESENDLVMSPGGERIAFTSGGSFVSIDPWGEERKNIHGSNVSDARVSLDGTRVSFIAGGQAHTAPIAGGEVTTLGIDADAQVDRAAERAQKFRETAQRFGMDFYHPTLKGVDWDAITARYEGLALTTRTNQAFQRVIDLMFGELDGSHTGIRGGDGFSAPGEQTGYLGIDASPAARGYRIDRVHHRGPIDTMDDGPAAGDILVAVGDTRLMGDGPDAGLVDLSNAMRGTRGDEILIEYLRHDPGAEDGPWVTRYGRATPVGHGAYTVIRYRQAVLDRRAEVEALSDGRLGYLHIRAMGASSVREFERDLFAAADGKDGLVIDVRDNGGGWTTDILLASLTAPAHAYTIPRGADPEDVAFDSYPRDRRLIYSYARPIVVLINENSFSNAEIFAHSIKTTGRGRLVGTQTFGGVISTGSFTLIDGTRVRRPFRGWYLPDGTDMENNGAEPDLKVEQTPADEAAGRDPQLEAAVRDLLRTVD